MTEDLQHPWEKQEGESSTWFRRFERFRLLFPVRSVALVYQQEQEQPGAENSEKQRKLEPPGHWYEAAKKWQWQKRAEAWDAHLTAEEEEAKKRVLSSGLALTHRRILLLEQTLGGLLAMAGDESKVWIPDVKGIGFGEDMERVDLVRFNDALFKQIREYIADIAAETGDRVKKKEVNIKSLPANVYVGFDPDQDGIDDRELEEDEPEGAGDDL